jgi:hypothetical protein
MRYSFFSKPTTLLVVFPERRVHGLVHLTPQLRR